MGNCIVSDVQICGMNQYMTTRGQCSSVGDVLISVPPHSSLVFYLSGFLESRALDLLFAGFVFE